MGSGASTDIRVDDDHFGENTPPSGWADDLPIMTRMPIVPSSAKVAIQVFQNAWIGSCGETPVAYCAHL